jgi:DNA invertase Pin-like site-specific DNA recombinase
MFELIDFKTKVCYSIVKLQTKYGGKMFEEIPKNCQYGYGRVSSKSERLVFQKLIEEELQENDLLLVTKIDRCSRNTLEFLKLQEKLFRKSVRFISLDLPYSSDMAVNQLIATNLAAIATFENERRKERQREGIKAARKAGQYLGRRTVITKKLIAEVQDLKETKNLSITQIAKVTERGRSTIYKVLKEELNYIPYNRLVKNDN